MQESRPMPRPDAADRWWWLVPATTFLFLIGFAANFPAERLYSDSSYYLARVIAQGGFHIEHGRWVLALSQVLPLAGQQLGLPMKTLILLHSLNNVVWAGLCMLIAHRLLHDRAAVMALALVHVVGLAHGLFCPMFELYYGVDLLILVLAAMPRTDLHPLFRWPLLVLCAAGCFNSHFFGAGLALLALVAIRVWRFPTTAAVLAVTFVGVNAIHFLGLSSYERSRLDVLDGLTDPQRLAVLITPERLRGLGGYLVQHYADALLLAGVVLALLIGARRFRAALLFAGGSLLLHVLAGLYKPGFYHDRYLEQVQFVMPAWTVIAFFFLAWPHVRAKGPLLLLLLACLIYRIGYAVHVAPMYTARTAHIEHLITLARQQGSSKGIIHAPRYFGNEDQIVDLSWSTPVESLLLSARAHPDSTVSLITSEDLAHERIAEQLHLFIFRRWEVMDTDRLDPRYFRAPQGRYIPLEAEVR